MSWNHRIIRFPAPPGGEPTLQICEVYYDDEYDGEPPRSVDPTPFLNGESITELKELIQRLELALTKPILNLRDFPNTEGEKPGKKPSEKPREKP